MPHPPLSIAAHLKPQQNLVPLVVQRRCHGLPKMQEVDNGGIGHGGITSSRRSAFRLNFPKDAACFERRTSFQQFLKATTSFNSKKIIKNYGK